MSLSPILTISNFFLFPKCEAVLLLDNSFLKMVVLESLSKFHGNLIIVPFTQYSDPLIKNGSIGILAKIVLNFNIDDVSLVEAIEQMKKVRLLGISRVRLLISSLEEKEKKDGELLVGHYEMLSDEINDEKTMRVFAEKLSRTISDILERCRLSPADVRAMGDSGTVEIIDFIVQNSREIDNSIKQEVFNEINPEKRLEILLNLPNRKKIDNELDEVTRRNIKREQEAYYLLKKKEAIERRLRESRGYAGEEIKKILNRLDKEPFPRYIKELVYQRIEELEMMPSTSGEANMIKVYID